MMSSAISGSPQVKTERRSHVRRKMGGLTYVDLGPLNGGILVDLSQGGLCFHSVAPMSLDPAVLLKFKLPGAVGFIQSYAEVMWLNESGKRGGLRFAGLSAEVREQIGTWVGATEIGTEAPQESDTIHEHSSAELNAVPVPQDSNERGVLGANRSSEDPVGHQADSMPMQQPEAAEAVLKTAEPGAENPIVRPAANAAVRARAIAEVSPERVANRVHSGMMAASALEWSARAPRIAPSQGSAAGPVTHSKQATVSHALKPSSPPNRTLNQEWAPQREAVASPMLKVGIGAAAGAVLALAFVAGMPWLRIRALATTKGKSAALSLKDEIPEFQVEVADINNRRWILKSEDNTGSPFRAGTQGRATESERSSDVPETRRPRPAKRGGLALAHPLSGQPAGSQVQSLPPSIFDGITPPLGSLTNNLPLNELIAPGPVPAPRPAANIQAAVLLKHVSPVYPVAALRDNISGEVRIRATIGKDGIPTDLKILSGDPRLVDAAAGAIRQWRYRPATLEGEPIETTITVNVAFQLN
jgi:TonB family protein